MLHKIRQVKDRAIVDDFISFPSPFVWFCWIFCFLKIHLEIYLKELPVIRAILAYQNESCASVCNSRGNLEPPLHSRVKQLAEWTVAGVPRAKRSITQDYGIPILTTLKEAKQLIATVTWPAFEEEHCYKKTPYKGEKYPLYQDNASLSGQWIQ